MERITSDFPCKDVCPRATTVAYLTALLAAAEKRPEVQEYLALSEEDRTSFKQRRLRRPTRLYRDTEQQLEELLGKNWQERLNECNGPFVQTYLVPQDGKPPQKWYQSACGCEVTAPHRRIGGHGGRLDLS